MIVLNSLLADDGTKPHHCASQEFCQNKQVMHQINGLKEAELIRNPKQAEKLADKKRVFAPDEEPRHLLNKEHAICEK